MRSRGGSALAFRRRIIDGKDCNERSLGTTAGKQTSWLDRRADEESLDSGHTPGIAERGKSRTAARGQIRLEAEVSSREPRMRPVS